MDEFPHPPWPIVEFGVAAATIGSVAAILILLPILSIPLSVCGLACGIVGVVAAWKGYPISLRTAVAGTALCVVVLSAGLLVAFAPRDQAFGRISPRLWQQPSTGRPAVPPPAQAR
jgi:hypothetical protein